MITNYNLQNSNNTISSNIGGNFSSQQQIQNQNFMHGQNNINNTTTTNNQSHNTQHGSGLHYNLVSSSSELPFIQRLNHTSTNQTNTNNVNTNQNNFDSFPKINLQVPSMLSPGEVGMMNGYNTYSEPNIDMYIQWLLHKIRACPWSLQARPNIANQSTNPLSNLYNNSNNILEPHSTGVGIQTGTNIANL